MPLRGRYHVDPPLPPSPPPPPCRRRAVATRGRNGGRRWVVGALLKRTKPESEAAACICATNFRTGAPCQQPGAINQLP
eukprot:CAMPEP_0119492260 /NCGR_PEP_ID=MMETSP1344-20130328/16866_1 /TAXON_ID=236787 /ORGANISM="Florenciella parvula, Strain CCMP2471" /LENGTH=78 /DNA_ID=CAMNT_0007527577 /DNA_START=12 /DNA_END=248 /DNA_ORIENTATION=-